MENISKALDNFYELVNEYQYEICDQKDYEKVFELVKFVEENGITIDDFGYDISSTLLQNEEYVLKTLEYLRQSFSNKRRLSNSGFDLLCHISVSYSNFSDDAIKSVLSEFLKLSIELPYFDHTGRLGDYFDRDTNPP